jgi:fatty acid synthase, animal type
LRTFRETLIFTTIPFSSDRIGVLADDGFCRPFDKGASGYTRSEAICVIFLQKAPEAKRVYANMVYCRTNNDGFKKEAITFPAATTQIELMERFYKDLGMPASSVDFVEGHITGTVIGDPQECHTIDTVFCKGRTKPLPVGSVKSNIGHTEGASGMCSIAKVMITFENQMIPPNLHIVQPNPDIPSLAEGRLRVVREAEKLAGPLISINSFGFGGSNAHALFKSVSKPKVNSGIPLDNVPRLVVWSGRTEEAVQSILNSVSLKPLDAEYVGLLHNSQAVSVSTNRHRRQRKVFESASSAF